ncbi:MAG: DUF3179 domain-containing protein [Candidatus Thorarchaeota archaeon]|jgi:hypothetical protein
MDVKRSSILVILLLVAAFSVGFLIDPNNIPDPGQTTTTTTTTPITTLPPPPIIPFPGSTEVTLVYPVDTARLNDILQNVQSGGPAPDGIPPIENPDFVTAETAMDFLDDSDIVFGLAYREMEIAYPQSILVWHEIVNYNIEGAPISVTYCPLTGSTIAFHGKLSDGSNTTFGTSGRLVNSNLVMYDRATNSYFPQILSQAINGPSLGVGLQRIQMYFTSWGAWRSLHPNTIVLSENTGFVRNYNFDPYGDYDDPNSYYNSGAPGFPIMHTDSRLQPKEVVVGIDVNGTQLAIKKSDMRDWEIYNFQFGETKYVVLYDHVLDVARSYLSRVNGQDLTFRMVDGEIMDDETQNVWTPYGTSDLGTLPVVANMDVMWFAWAAYFPNTDLLCTGCS